MNGAKEKREHSRDFHASANKKVNCFNLIMLLLNVGPGIDTFQIDCKLPKLFSIYLKGFRSLDYTSCCLADRRAAMYADMLLNISLRCLWRYRQLRFPTQQFHLCLLITPQKPPRMNGGFTMSIQQKPINEVIWSSKAPNTEVMTANIITYIFYCCLVHSQFGVRWRRSNIVIDRRLMENHLEKALTILLWFIFKNSQVY